MEGRGRHVRVTFCKRRMSFGEGNRGGKRQAGRGWRQAGREGEAGRRRKEGMHRRQQEEKPSTRHALHGCYELWWQACFMVTSVWPLCVPSGCVCGCRQLTPASFLLLTLLLVVVHKSRYVSLLCPIVSLL